MNKIFTKKYILSLLSIVTLILWASLYAASVTKITDNQDLNSVQITVDSWKSVVFSFSRIVDNVAFSKDSGFTIRTLEWSEWINLSNIAEDYTPMKGYLVRNNSEWSLIITANFLAITNETYTSFQKTLKAGWNLVWPAYKDDENWFTDISTIFGENYSQIVDLTWNWFSNKTSSWEFIDDSLVDTPYIEINETNYQTINQGQVYVNDRVNEILAYAVLVDSDVVLDWTQLLSAQEYDKDLAQNEEICYLTDDEKKVLNILISKDYTKTQLCNLTSIDLSNKNLVAIPDLVYKLKNLKFLKLSLNSISQLSDKILQLNNLEWLDISNNSFTSLPDYLYDLTSLKILSVWNAVVDQNTSSYNRNNITTISSNISNLTNLVYLALSWNSNLSTIASLNSLTNLETLWIDRTAITQIPSIDSLTNLKALYINDTNITKLPNYLANLTSLNTLYLNNISSLWSLQDSYDYSNGYIYTKCQNNITTDDKRMCIDSSWENILITIENNSTNYIISSTPYTNGNLSVTVKDSNWNVDTSYRWTLNITSTNPNANLIGELSDNSYTFTQSDNWSVNLTNVIEYSDYWVYNFNLSEVNATSNWTSTINIIPDIQNSALTINNAYVWDQDVILNKFTIDNYKNVNLLVNSIKVKLDEVINSGDLVASNINSSDIIKVSLYKWSVWVNNILATTTTIDQNWIATFNTNSTMIAWETSNYIVTVDFADNSTLNWKNYRAELSSVDFENTSNTIVTLTYNNIATTWIDAWKIVSLENAPVYITDAVVNNYSQLWIIDRIYWASNITNLSIKVSASWSLAITMNEVKIKLTVDWQAATNQEIAKIIFKEWNTSLSELAWSQIESDWTVSFNWFTSNINQNSFKDYNFSIDLADNSAIAWKQIWVQFVDINTYDTNLDTVNYSINSTYWTSVNILDKWILTINEYWDLEDLWQLIDILDNLSVEANKTILAWESSNALGLFVKATNEDIKIAKAVFTLSGVTETDLKASINNASLYLAWELIATNTNADISWNTITFDNLTNLIIPQEDTELKLELNTENIGYQKVGKTILNAKIVSLDTTLISWVESWKNIDDQSISISTWNFSIVPAVIVPFVIQWINTTQAKVNLAVNSWNNTVDSSNTAPSITITDFVFSELGDATDWYIIYVDANSSRQWTISSAWIFDQWTLTSSDLTISSNKTYVIEPVWTSGKTYQLLLNKNWIVYDVNSSINANWISSNLSEELDLWTKTY